MKEVSESDRNKPIILQDVSKSWGSSTLNGTVLRGESNSLRVIEAVAPSIDKQRLRRIH